jgi:gluconokinase
MARNGSLVITGLRGPVAPVVVMMGVAGTGKSAVGSAFAEATGWAFLDADDFHPEANLRKMRSGVPLTDADRWPWLEDLSQLLRDHQGRGERCVLACSALKQSYRALLEEAAPSARWFHLHGPSDLIASRLRSRSGHFMGAEMLQSQLRDLEPPSRATRLDIRLSVEELLQCMIKALAEPAEI